MMLDVFSRKIVAHEVHEAESAELAVENDNYIGRRIDSSELQLSLTCCLT